MLEVKLDDTPRIPEPILRAAVATPSAEPERPTRRLLTGKFSFVGNGTPAKPVLAVKSQPRAEEAEPRPAGEQRTLEIVGPTTQKAAVDGMIHADFPDGIALSRATKRTRVMQWVQLKSIEPGITNVEVAKRLGISTSHLQGCLTEARKEGWLRFEDPMSRMEFEIIPKTLDNLAQLLDNKDKTATIETAKGTIFKSYLNSQGISEQPQTVLALRIDRADGENMNIVTGRIVGKSKYGHSEVEEQ